MTLDELLQVTNSKLVPEEQEVLTAELLRRGWNEQKIAERRTNLEKQKLQPKAGNQSPLVSKPLGNSTFWGILGGIFAILGTELSWGYMLPCAIVALIFFGQATKCRQWAMRARQIERDKAAQEILDQLGAKSVERNDV